MNGRRRRRRSRGRITITSLSVDRAHVGNATNLRQDASADDLPPLLKQALRK